MEPAVSGQRLCLLSKAGAHVVTTARSDPASVPSGLDFVRADVATSDGVAAVVKRAQELLGGVDIVISNVGGQTFRPGGALELTDGDYQADLDSNLMSAVRLDRALIPDMIQRGDGAVVHIGSGAARIARPQTLAYTVAKAALTAYSKGLASDVGPHGVRVNVVHPGIIRTDRLNDRLSEVAKQTATSQNPCSATWSSNTPSRSGGSAPPKNWPRLSSFWCHQPRPTFRAHRSSLTVA